MGVVQERAIIITRDLKGTIRSITGVPTTITAYAHGFNKVPAHVFITHTDYGTTGIVREIRASRNTSSISLQANISGVGVDVVIIP